VGAFDRLWQDADKELYMITSDVYFVSCSPSFVKLVGIVGECLDYPTINLFEISSLENFSGLPACDDSSE
jgi:hypothetical protein